MQHSNYKLCKNVQQTQPHIKPILIYLAFAAILLVGIAGCQANTNKDTVADSTKVATLVNEYTDYDSARNAIQADYNTALARLDSLTGNNIQFTGQLADKKNDIDKLKTEIRMELTKKDAELKTCRGLVDQLNASLTSLMEQVSRQKK
jgi:hypothetical protein